MTIDAFLTNFTDFFRLTYETCETVVRAQNLPHVGRLQAPEYLLMINKIAINGIDMVSTFLNVKGSKNSGLKIGLNIAEGGHRLIEICRGIYISKNLTKSKQAAAFQQIMLELLNVARLGLNTLNLINNDNGLNSTLYGVFVDVSLLAVSLADSVFRIHSLFSQRIAIHKQLSHLAHNKNLTLIGRKLDYPGRVLGHTLCLIKSFSFGIGYLAMISMRPLGQSDSDFDFTQRFKQTFKLLVFTQLLSFYYSQMINSCINAIFKHFGVQPSANSERVKFVFSSVASAFISMATAVGLGLHPSIKELICRTFIVTFSLFAGLTAMIVTGVGFFQAIKNATGSDGLSTVLGGSLTGLSPISTFPIFVGIGLAPTLRDAGLNWCHGLFFTLSRAEFVVFWDKLNSLPLKGPMNWNEIFRQIVVPFPV